MVPLLTVASGEWYNHDSWRPVEEPAGGFGNPPQIQIGRGWDLYVLRCPTSFDHPFATYEQ